MFRRNNGKPGVVAVLPMLRPTAPRGLASTAKRALHAEATTTTEHDIHDNPTAKPTAIPHLAHHPPRTTNSSTQRHQQRPMVLCPRAPNPQPPLPLPTQPITQQRPQEPVELTDTSATNLPVSGVLEFDYVSTAKAPPDSVPATDAQVNAPW